MRETASRRQRQKERIIWSIGGVVVEVIVIILTFMLRKSGGDFHGLMLSNRLGLESIVPLAVVQNSIIFGSDPAHHDFFLPCALFFNSSSTLILPHWPRRCAACLIYHYEARRAWYWILQLPSLGSTSNEYLMIRFHFVDGPRCKKGHVNVYDTTHL
jgi:hypothetical protein